MSSASKAGRVQEIMKSGEMLCNRNNPRIFASKLLRGKRSTDTEIHLKHVRVQHATYKRT